jgi:DNA polymerase-3 subunit epsilon
VKKFAVLDIETTGLGKKDRVLEIGIVLMDGKEVIYEWETLINPERDISNEEIHGLTATMLSSAPTFREIENDLKKLMNGRILVAHNAIFERRMLEQEFSRLGRPEDFSNNYCTYKATGKNLKKACEFYSIPLTNHHSAMDDARATSQLLRQLDLDSTSIRPLSLSYRSDLPATLIITRAAYSAQKNSSFSPLRNLMQEEIIHSSDFRKLSYLDLLVHSLSDLNLSLQEAKSLQDWANDLGLSELEISEIHEEYVSSLINMALRDGILTDEEWKNIDKVCSALGVSMAIPYKPSNQSDPFFKGARICFTGSAKARDGNSISREDLEKLAASKGFNVVDSVTKKGCDLVIAADVNSMSSKARAAKSWGIPVISAKEFLAKYE